MKNFLKAYKALQAPRNEQLHLKLNEFEMDILDNLIPEYGNNRSDIVRYLIFKHYIDNSNIVAIKDKNFIAPEKYILDRYDLIKNYVQEKNHDRYAIIEIWEMVFEKDKQLLTKVIRHQLTNILKELGFTIYAKKNYKGERISAFRKEVSTNEIQTT